MDQVIAIAFGLLLAIIDFIRSHPAFAAIIVAVLHPLPQFNLVPMQGARQS